MRVTPPLVALSLRVVSITAAHMDPQMLSLAKAAVGADSRGNAVAAVDLYQQLIKALLEVSTKPSQILHQKVAEYLHRIEQLQAHLPASTITCSQCTIENECIALACHMCGGALPQPCHSCAHRNSPEAARCQACGSSLLGSSQSVVCPAAARREHERARVGALLKKQAHETAERERQRPTQGRASQISTARTEEAGGGQLSHVQPAELQPYVSALPAIEQQLPPNEYQLPADGHHQLPANEHQRLTCSRLGDEDRSESRIEGPDESRTDKQVWYTQNSRTAKDDSGILCLADSGTGEGQRAITEQQPLSESGLSSVKALNDAEVGMLWSIAATVQRVAAGALSLLYQPEQDVSSLAEDSSECRGECIGCHLPVLIRHRRAKGEDGNYWHYGCVEIAMHQQKVDADTSWCIVPEIDTGSGNITVLQA